MPIISTYPMMMICTNTSIRFKYGELTVTNKLVFQIYAFQRKVDVCLFVYFFLS